jgi:mycothiol system anti-sigma-R factor
MIDCREAVRRMWAYLDQALERSPADELEAHLETCQRCCGELEFSRHVRQLVAADEDSPTLPPKLRSRIEGLIGRQAAEPGGER